MFAPKVILTAASALAMLLPMQASAGDTALKNTAVLGGLVSYGYAYFNRDRVDCTQRFGLVAQNGKDEELKSSTLGLSFMDCSMRPTASGIGFRIEPTLLATSWSASRGPGVRSASELTLVPRVQYVLPVGAAKLDVMFGIGPSYLSEHDIGGRRKSTRFQFSNELGFGISNASETVRLGLGYRHISNAGIKSPNNAVDFRGITLNVRMP